MVNIKLILALLLIPILGFSQSDPRNKYVVGNSPGDTVVLYNTTLQQYLRRTLFLKPTTSDRGRFFGLNPNANGTQVMPIIRDTASTLWFKQPAEAVTYGSNLTTNGTFTGSLTGWTSTNWTLSSDKALHTTGNTSALSQSIGGIVLTAPYQVVITTSGRTAGSITVSLGGYTSDAISTNTTTTIPLYPTSGGTQTLSINPTSAFDGAVDDITLKIFIAGRPASVFGANGEIRAPAISGLFFGYKSGEFNIAGGNFGIGETSLSRITTGFSNTGVGLGALENLQTGIENTANGFYALRNLKKGSYNTAQGDYAGYSNVNGNQNDYKGSNAGYFHTGDNACINGAFAGFGLTTYSSPTILGSLGLRNLSTGSSAIGIGMDVGRFIADLTTPFTIGSNLIYIGDNINASGNSITNETVVGHGQTGKGSNTQVYGNSSVTSTYLLGNIALGTSYTPSAKLHLPAGTTTLAPFKFTSGTNLTTPQAGAVEWDGVNVFVTQTTGPTRKTVAYIGDVTGESTSIGAFNNSGTSNGLSLSGSALSLHAATISTPGAVNTGQQTFTSGAGSKYFNGTGTAQISVDGNTDATEAGINFTQVGGADIMAQMQVNSSDVDNARFQLLIEDAGSYVPKLIIGSLNDQKGVQESGGLYEEVTNVTSSPYAVIYGDRNIYLDGATITVNLQAIGTSTGETKIGRVIYFFNDNATNVTITPNGSETIADAASLTLLPNTGVTLLAVTGTQWAIRD